MVHAHVTSWFLAIILFIVAVNLHKGGKEKGLKIVQMILRVLYIAIVATGAHLLATWQFQGLVVVKSLLGLWVIFSMEFILTRAKKEKPTKVFWIQFIISLILALIFGFVII